MSWVTVRTLPGVPASEGPFRFLLDEPARIVHIEADTRGPDVAIACKPAQEAWMNAQGPDVTQTWDCQWTFRDRAAMDAFVARLDVVRPEAPPPPPPPVATSPDEVTLAGGTPGNVVEVARAGDVAVALGFVTGRDRPWDTAARRGPDAFDGLVAYWRDTFPTVAAGSAPRALARAQTLAASPRAWVTYCVGGIGGARTHRVLDLGARVAVDTLGRTPKRSVFASLAEALDHLGPRDVACDLTPPTAAEVAEIEALPLRTRRTKPRAPRAGAPFPERLRAALRRLDGDDVLALADLPGPTSRAWELADVRRERRHYAVVFARRDQLDATGVSLHWRCDEADRDRLFSALERACGALGLAVTRPRHDREGIAIRPAP